ncbi:aminodeoxychorismate synthase component I [Eionea flava]
MSTHYHIRSIPYYPSSETLFSAIRHLPFACWLDSGKPDSTSGRYDILTAQPTRRWVTQDNNTAITDYQYRVSIDASKNKTADIHCTKNTQTSDKSPLSLLKQACEVLVTRYKNITLPTPELPFTGGIVSYISYTVGRQQLEIPLSSSNDCDIPDMVAGLYTWAIIQDHHEAKSYVVALPECELTLIDYVEQCLSNQSDISTKKTFSIGELSSNISQDEYHSKMAIIDDYIRAGDCYQVNFAQRFSAPYQGDPFDAYLSLRRAMSSPFSAFITVDDTTGIAPHTSPQAILSFSPERFLRVRNQHVLTQPIKGTIARDSDPSNDQANALHLQKSQKNRAENVMIVDLLRNDLGKSCVPGSIHVPALFALESFPNVHHLVSNVEGTLQQHVSAVDLFDGCFPGGSITGAPKKRAMEIIEELEDSQRSIYCGSIAYFTSWGDMDSSITIRTIACDGHDVYCWGGGGIVADSNAEEEYQESLTKIGKILRALNTFHQNPITDSTNTN